MTILENINEFTILVNNYQDTVRQLQNELKEKSSEAMKVLFQAFFKKHSYIKVLTWNQYTPYFNDGEPCEFGIGELYALSISLEELRSNEDSSFSPEEYSVYERSQYMIDNYPEEAKFWFNLCDLYGKELLSQLTIDLRDMEVLLTRMEDILQITLGDHITVFVTPEGIITEDYEHE